MALLLEVKDLVKSFPQFLADPVQAVAGVNLKLESGQTHGLVGESGCGKSTVARTIMLLEKPTSGEALF